MKRNLNELLEEQLHVHKRYLVANLFRLTLIKMIDLLTKDTISRPGRCHFYTIEWYICGLPHVHIAIWFMEKAHSSQIDSIISAELTDAIDDRTLYECTKGSWSMDYVVQ